MSGNELREIKGLIPPENELDPLLAVLGVVLIVGVLGLLCLRRRKRANAEEPASHERALRALQSLENPDSLDPATVIDYYTELSHVITRYLMDRYQLTRQMTTEEWLVQLDGIGGLSPSSKSLIRHFLTACDLVKFAREIPPPLEIAESRRMAREIVEGLEGRTLP